MPLCAAPYRCSQSRSCKYALLLGALALSQAEGRRFEPGLALQQTAFRLRKFPSSIADFPLNSFAGEFSVELLGALGVGALN